VYFNGIGWIDFEPTPAYPLIGLDQTSDDRTGPEGIVDGLDPASALLAVRPVLVWGTGLTFLAIVALFGWDRIKFRRSTARGLLIMARERVQQIAFDLGVEQPGSATLNELRASLSAMIAARFPEWFSRRSEAILANLIAPLAEAAYRGKPPETFQRRGITASLLHARRVSILIRLSNFFKR
jgi:hypothetical protein